MLRLKVEGDLNSLFEGTMGLMLSKEEKDKSWIDCSQTPRIITFNSLLQATSCKFDFDLSKVGFTKIRWPRYIHAYIDKEKLKDWLESLPFISKHGDSLFRSKDMNRRPRDHKYGACWIGLSFHLGPPTIVLYSRVAEFPTRAILELTMVTKMAEEIASRMKINVEDIHFTWFISSIFLSCLHMVPFLAHRGELESTSSRDDLVGHFVNHQLNHIAKGNIHYGPTKRMAKRLEQFRAGETKKVPIKDLSLWV